MIGDVLLKKYHQMKVRARWWSEDRGVPFPMVLRNGQLSFASLIILMSLMALCCSIAKWAGWGIGGLLFVLFLAMRWSIIDFTWKGDAATGFVLVGGFVFMLCLIQYLT